MKYSKEDKEYLISNYSNLSIAPDVFINKLRRPWLTIQGYCQGTLKLKRRPLYKIDSNYFDNVDCWEKAYFVGFLWSDGSNFRPKNRIVLNLKEEDKYILESLKNLIGYKGELNYSKPRMAKGYVNPRKGQYVLRFVDKHMSELLESRGMTQSKTLDIKFPDFIPYKFISGFILGVFDGDGTVVDDKTNRFSICGSFDMMSKIQQILIKECSLNETKLQKVGNSYLLNYGGKFVASRIREYLYKDHSLCLVRKKQRFDNIYEKTK